MVGRTTPGYRVDPSDGCKRVMLCKCIRELLIVTVETSLLLALVAFAGVLSVPDSEPLRPVDLVRSEGNCAASRGPWVQPGFAAPFQRGHPAAFRVVAIAIPFAIGEALPCTLDR